MNAGYSDLSRVMGFVKMDDRTGIADDGSHLAAGVSLIAQAMSSRVKRSIRSTRLRRTNSDMAARTTSGSDTKKPDWT